MTASTRSEGERHELLEIAQEAFVWGMPLVQWGWYRRIREYWYYPKNRPFGRLGVIEDDYAPSQELLYALIDFDLSDGPQVLRLPEIEDRFFSFQFCDSFFNPFAYISLRTHGSGGGDFAICPPGWEGTLPEGMERLDCPLDRVMTYGRTGVKSRDDQQAAIEVASQYRVGPLATFPEGMLGHFRASPAIGDYELFPAPFRADTDGPRFFDKLCQELLDTPFGPDQQELAARFARINVAPGLWPTELCDKELRDILKEGVRLGHEQVVGCDAVTVVNGWRTVYGIGARYDDFVLRAHLQREGGGVNVAEEATYYRSFVGPDGEPLNGKNRYRLHFPAGQLPPVNAFWSLSQLDSEGIPIQNPLNRFAVSSLMPEGRPGPDGSVTILLQPDEPDPSEGVWLPTGEGDFQLFMRFYLPQEPLLTGSYEPPALEILD
jgi:hypothetical protein